MALKKSVTTPYGIAVEYWKIASIREDYLANRVDVILGGYVDQAARTAGASPLNRKDVVIEGEAYSVDMDREDLYEEIKKLVEWTDAEDC